MRHPLFIILLIFLLPVLGVAQKTARPLLDKAGSLVHSMHFEMAEGIVDSLLTNNLSEVDRAKAMMVKAQVLERLDDFDSAIDTALSALKLAEDNGQLDVSAGLHITLSLIHERTGNPHLGIDHLNLAKRILFDHQLEQWYGQYFVRRASLMRILFRQENRTKIEYEEAKSRFKDIADSAEIYARKFDQQWHLADAHLLLGSFYTVADMDMLLYHRKAAIKIYMEAGEYISAGYMYYAIATLYTELDSLDLGWAYYDTAEAAILRDQAIPSGFLETKAELFRKSGQMDSVIATLKAEKRLYANEVNEQNRVEIARLAIVHENKEKQSALNAQMREIGEQQKLLNRTIALLVAVLLILALLFFGYRRQRMQNAKITEQRKELVQSLDKQKVLLAEVQHRVKNNLQVIIAMLDMQSEAIGYKSIEEITRENQRRIESMAFLHDKVYLSDDLERVKLESYLNQIAELLRSTYTTEDASVDITINSEIDSVPVDKAIPLGLITVELFINSYKHAFKGKEKGSILITASETSESRYSFLFVYQDDGPGYETTQSSSGLGLEIINGLTGQLHGIAELDGSDGFKATIKF